MTAEQEILTVARTKDGLPVEEDLAFEFAPADARGPALLLIATGWLKKAMRFKRQDVYAVTETGSDFGGRGFRLDRTADVVAADPDRVTHYAVHVAEAPADDTCDCKGQYGAETRGQWCKHRHVIRHLVETRRL